MGPMTGRGMGYCAGFDAPGFVRPGVGSGRGRGWGARGGYGRGMRWGHGYGRGVVRSYWDVYGGVPAGAPAPAPADEASALKAQAEYLEEALKDVQRRLSDLEPEE